MHFAFTTHRHAAPPSPDPVIALTPKASPARSWFHTKYLRHSEGMRWSGRLPIVNGSAQSRRPRSEVDAGQAGVTTKVCPPVTNRAQVYARALADVQG